MSKKVSINFGGNSQFRATFKKEEYGVIEVEKIVWNGAGILEIHDGIGMFSTDIVGIKRRIGSPPRN